MLDIESQAETVRRELQAQILKIGSANPDAVRQMDDNAAVTKLLSDLFQLVARLTRGQPGRQWVADASHPGFLVSQSAGGTMVAPFHLVADLPSGSALDDIRAIAADIKLGTDSSLCLSGSIVLLGDPLYAGDLDFCEYIRVSERSNSLQRLTAIAEHTGAVPICTKIKLGDDGRLTRPWPQSVTEQHLDQLLGGCSEGGHGKLDIVTIKPTTGPIEATNLMVWVPDGDTDSYAAGFSFPFQEIDPGSNAPIAAPWIPRQLARPSSIASYVRFLRGDIENYRSIKPVKALKRALSLATFLMLPDRQEQIISLGLNTEAFEAEAIAQRRDLITQVATHKAPDVAELSGKFQAAFNDWTDGMALTRHNSQSHAFSKSVEVLIDSLLGDIATIRPAM